MTCASAREVNLCGVTANDLEGSVMGEDDTYGDMTDAMRYAIFRSVENIMTATPPDYMFFHPSAFPWLVRRSKLERLRRQAAHLERKRRRHRGGR